MKQLALIPLFLLLAGCAHLKTEADPLVVRAEQTTVIAFETFDKFLLWEKAYGSSPEVHMFAERLRRDAPTWLLHARSLTTLYKKTRDPNMRPDMIASLAVLEHALALAQKELAQ